MGINQGGPVTNVKRTLTVDSETLDIDEEDISEEYYESKVIFEDHGNNALGQIEVSHAGSSDDEKGQLIIKTNNDSGLQTAVTIDEAQDATFASNVKVVGDIILDDGGSLKEAGGTAAITFDGSGHVTKIGQDSASSGQFLKWDGSKWVADTVSGTVAGSVAADDISTGDAAVTIATSTGNITIDAQAGDADIILKGTDGGSDITALTLDMSEAGAASFNNAVTVGTDLTVTGGDVTYGNGQNATMSVAATAHNAAGKALTISAGTTTAGTTNDIAGGALTIKGGAGKGTGAGGDIIFQTANAAGGSASSINSHATAMTISDDLGVTCAADVAVGDDLFLTSDSSVLNMGAGNDFSIAHDGTTGATLAGNPITITSGGACTWSASAGNVTIDSAAAGLILDGHTGVTVQSTDSGNITLDSVGDIKLDAAGNDIKCLADTTEFLRLSHSSGDAVIRSIVSDEDLIFKGSDAGSTITALTLDMSAGGAAIFRDMVTVGTDLNVDGGDIVYGNGQDATMSITATAHDTAGKPLTISAGSTTAGTTNDIAGGALTFKGGAGKGTGAGGSIIFQTADGAGSTGSSVNSLATAVTIFDNKNVQFEADLVIKDDLYLLSDASRIWWGANSEVTMKHVHNSGITLTSAQASPAIRMTLESTNADEYGPSLEFNKNGASPANADKVGTIIFNSEDDGAASTTFGRIECKIDDVAAGSESSTITINVAEYDGTETTGLSLVGSASADGVVDVTIGAGAGSTATVAGDLDVGDDLSLTTDSSVFNMGAGNDFTITHDGTTGATLAGNPITITSGGACTWSASAGNVTIDSAAAGLILDGHTGVTVQSTDSGNITLDSVGDIKLDAAGNDIKCLAGSAGEFLRFSHSSGDALIRSLLSDKDMLFKGNDGGATITALTLDMSDAGAAYFNNAVNLGGTTMLGSGGLLNLQDCNMTLGSNQSGAEGKSITFAHSRNATDGSHTVVQDNDVLGSLLFQGSDGDSLEAAAKIEARVDGTPGDGDMPGELVFSTTADGAISPTQRMAIRADGSVDIKFASATATGAGFSNAALCDVSVSKVNGIIETTILVDIHGINSKNSDGFVLGDGTEADASLTKLTSAVNGIIYAVEMGCIETPGNGETDIDLVVDTGVRAAGYNIADNASDISILTSGGDWVLGEWHSTQNAPSQTNDLTNGLVNYYVYLVAGASGGGTGAYNAGKFVIKFKGASF